MEEFSDKEKCDFSEKPASRAQGRKCQLNVVFFEFSGDAASAESRDFRESAIFRDIVVFVEFLIPRKMLRFH